MKKVIYLITLVTLMMTIACTSRPIRSSVYDNNKVANYEWSPEDSESTAKTLMEKMVSDGWYPEALEEKDGEKPQVVIGVFKNKTSEHISTEAFIKDLETAMVSTRKVKFVSNFDRAADERRNVDEGIINSSEETAKSLGQEVAADFMLFGQINLIINRTGGVTHKYYQIELELHNVETHEVVWIGQKKIRKQVVQNRSSW